jgi:hypothetical protein
MHQLKNSILKVSQEVEVYLAIIKEGEVFIVTDTLEEYDLDKPLAQASIMDDIKTIKNQLED